MNLPVLRKSLTNQHNNMDPLQQNTKTNTGTDGFVDLDIGTPESQAKTIADYMVKEPIPQTSPVTNNMLSQNTTPQFAVPQQTIPQTPTTQTPPLNTISSQTPTVESTGMSEASILEQELKKEFRGNSTTTTNTQTKHSFDEDTQHLTSLIERIDRSINQKESEVREKMTALKNLRSEIEIKIAYIKKLEEEKAQAQKDKDRLVTLQKEQESIEGDMVNIEKDLI